MNENNVMAVKKDLPVMAGETDHRNQQFPKLRSKVVLARLELPANLGRRGSCQFNGKLLQAGRHRLILRENRPQIANRR